MQAAIPTGVEDDAIARIQFNMRLDPRTSALLRGLQRKLNLPVTAVIRLAIARLAEAEQVEAPDDAE
jgi:hypothetical protein